MKIPKWTTLVLLRLLSLTGLTSATGDQASPLLIGLQFFPTTTPSLTSQPRDQLPSLGLELNFVLQVASHEFTVPIMPLHLLGKKSWNVYNQVNIDKVRRDEASAAALEAAEEQRMQELDAERRIQILRGEIPTPLPIEDSPPSPSSKPKRERDDYGSGSLRERKRRKKAGENDTEFEMRIVREDQAAAEKNVERQLVLRKAKEGDAPLVDRRGNIDLFPQPKPSKTPQTNPEVEKEAERKKKEYEDQYMMKFSNAAGFKQGLESPWYAQKGGLERKKEDEGEIISKDVWGNEDPRRKEREKARIDKNDPLAMMKAGARQVREVEKERKKWREEKERETRELERAEKDRRKHKRKRDSDGDDLEGFRLDEPERSSSRRTGDRDKDGGDRHRRKHSSRRSHRDDDGDRHKHRHRSRHHD